MTKARKKRNKLFIILGSAVIGAGLLTAAGVWLWQTHLTKEYNKYFFRYYPATAPSAEAAMANWPVYYSSAGRFSIKYPPDWQPVKPYPSQPDDETQTLVYFRSPEFKLDRQNEGIRGEVEITAFSNRDSLSLWDYYLLEHVYRSDLPTPRRYSGLPALEYEFMQRNPSYPVRDVHLVQLPPLAGATNSTMLAFRRFATSGDPNRQALILSMMMMKSFHYLGDQATL